jgi:hypothetical protein
MSNSGLGLTNASTEIRADKRRWRDDSALLIFVSALVFHAPVLAYIGTYSRGAVAVILVLLSVLTLLIVNGYVVLLLVYRIITLKLFRSPLLLVSIAILAGQLLIYRAAYHGIDLYRLFSNWSLYTNKVDASSPSPRFVTFDWGSSGFAGSSSWRYLLFDEAGHAGNPPTGTASTAASLIPAPNCSMSITHLWKQYYSVAISC